MSIKIKYAYLSGQTWMYRRHFPKDVQVITGQQAFKQTLKTSDAKEAKTRTSEVNTTFNQIVRKARGGGCWSGGRTCHSARRSVTGSHS
jgi:hypothetical protein